MTDASYAVQLADALIVKHGEAFFAATLNETHDRVFQIFNGVSCPVAEVEASTGNVVVLSRTIRPEHNISTPEGLSELISRHINWNWAD